MMRCFATCSFGTEALVRDEIQSLGLTIIKVEDARVVFEAQREGIIAANLYLRCADRVFVELHSFFARSFTELFDGVRAMPWHTWLPADANVTVTGKTALSDIKSIRDVQKLCKKALCDAMCAVHGYDRCPETGQEYQIEIGILRDRITVGLNTSGAGLNRRGYRDLSTKAPLRETLAAALVTLARYHGNTALVDPCCGSGTIAIEGAMIAAHMAPGLLRTFAFDGWKVWQADAHRIRERAKGQAREAGFAHLYGFDIDENQISIAHRHAKNAGVNGFINFETVDVHEFVPPSDNCVIVTNPPYGQRLPEGEALAVERALGSIKRDHPGIAMYILSADPDFERNFGQKADRRRKLYNGNMRCQLYMYRRNRKGRRGR